MPWHQPVLSDFRQQQKATRSFSFLYYYTASRKDFRSETSNSINMFSIAEALLLSFLMMTVASSPKPATEDFAFDAEIPLSDDYSLAEPLDNLDVLSSAPTDLFNLDFAPPPDIALDSDLGWGQEDLFASNIGTGASCHAEDIPASPAIGKLRARQGLVAKTGKETTCGAREEKIEDPDITKFWLQLEENMIGPAPTVRGSTEICPPLTYGDRDIPLCSSGNPSDEHLSPGLPDITLLNARSCTLLLRFGGDL
jgi:hypothetical protein